MYYLLFATFNVIFIAVYILSIRSFSTGIVHIKGRVAKLFHGYIFLVEIFLHQIFWIEFSID